MEFHKRFNKNETKEIINNKREIKPRSKHLQSSSQSNIINIKHYPVQKSFIPKINKNNKDKENYYSQDGNELFFYQMDSSLNNDTNSNINYQINNNNKENKIRNLSNISLENSNQSIIRYPLKKTYSQSLIINPLNKLEYSLNNRNINLSESIENNSYNINNNNSNSNELDIEINQEEKEDNSLKVRYHRARRYSPLYHNKYGYNNNINRIYYQDDINNEYNDINELTEIENNKNQIINKDNTLHEKQFIYSSDECQDNTLLSKYEEDKKFKKKKIVRKYSDLYEPGKNKKGILLTKTKLTYSLSSSPISIERNRNLSKNSKLSELIMNKKKYSPDNIKVQSYEDLFSCSEDKTTWQNDTRKRDKKTFNRRSFEKYQQSKTIIRLNKSPEERFRNISLAMISSKGKNTENRPILTNMRFERGGVVDLTQNDGKKHNFKYSIKKMKRPNNNEQIIHNNPKYREKAAQLIKEWWYAIKEYRKKRVLY